MRDLFPPGLDRPEPGELDDQGKYSECRDLDKEQKKGIFGGCTSATD
jgi:hypothetical protein